MVGTHKWIYAHYTHPDVILNQFINVRYNWWLERTNDSMLITPTQTSYWISLSTFTHKWLYAHYTHPDVILNQFINVPIIDGWNAQMTLCSLHPPRRLLNQFINVAIIDGWNAQMTLCSLHPPRRHIESVYQRSYNWWLERTNDSMLITPTQTILNQFINVPIIDGWNAQMTLCSLHQSAYQRSYNWWLGRTNDSMLITPTQTSNWISLSTFL